MRIGIDIDDTICNTEEIVHICLDKYSYELGINPLDIMNDEELKSNFFNIYMNEIYENVTIKRNCSDVINRLKSLGNEIYLITGRTRYFQTTSQNVFDITEEWLKKNNIDADVIITTTFSDTKADICKRYNIDLLIDDDPYNYKNTIALGKKCLLFDDHGKYLLKQDYVTDWLEVEKYINNNRE